MNKSKIYWGMSIYLIPKYLHTKCLLTTNGAISRRKAWRHHFNEMTKMTHHQKWDISNCAPLGKMHSIILNSPAEDA